VRAHRARTRNPGQYSECLSGFRVRR
jgi:hypothetical protein